METITLYLDTRNNNKSGIYTVKVRITKDRKSVYANTGIRVSESNWNPATRMLEGVREATRVNARLNNIINDVNECFATLEIKGKLQRMSLAELKELAEAVVEYGPEGAFVQRRKGEFIEAYRHTIETRNSEGTRRTYETSLATLMKYDPNVADYTFDDVTEQYVNTYIKYRFDQGRKNNTVSNDLKGLMTTFSLAVKEGKYSSNPCTDIHIKRGVVIHKDISAEELRRMFNNPHLDRTERKYVDMFKFMFLLRGINIADLAVIDKSQIINGRLEYDRLKTHTHISVKIEPEVEEMMRKYPSDKRLLSLFEGRTRNSLNTTLTQQLTRLYGVTAYSARHSVGSIAAELGFSLDIIAQLLGHRRMGFNTTLTYVRYKNYPVDDAMRAIIDFVLYDKKPS